MTTCVHTRPAPQRFQPQPAQPSGDRPRALPPSTGSSGHHTGANSMLSAAADVSQASPATHLPLCRSAPPRASSGGLWAGAVARCPPGPGPGRGHTWGGTEQQAPVTPGHGVTRTQDSLPSDLIPSEALSPQVTGSSGPRTPPPETSGAREPSTHLDTGGQSQKTQRQPAGA